MPCWKRWPYGLGVVSCILILLQTPRRFRGKPVLHDWPPVASSTSHITLSSPPWPAPTNSSGGTLCPRSVPQGRCNFCGRELGLVLQVPTGIASELLIVSVTSPHLEVDSAFHLRVDGRAAGGGQVRGAWFLVVPCANCGGAFTTHMAAPPPGQYAVSIRPLLHRVSEHIPDGACPPAEHRVWKGPGECEQQPACFNLPGVPKVETVVRFNVTKAPKAGELRRCDLSAGLIDGVWVGEQWRPSNCTLPLPAPEGVDLFNALLARGIHRMLFVGDSITRGICQAVKTQLCALPIRCAQRNETKLQIPGTRIQRLYVFEFRARNITSSLFVRCVAHPAKTLSWKRTQFEGRFDLAIVNEAQHLASCRPADQSAYLTNELHLWAQMRPKRLKRIIWMTTVTPMEWFIPASRYKPRMCFTSAALLRMFLQSEVRIVTQAGFDLFDMFHITAAREDWKHSGDAIHLGEQKYELLSAYFFRLLLGI